MSSPQSVSDKENPEANYLEIIKIVMSERGKLRKVSSELLDLISPYTDKFKEIKYEDNLKIKKKILELTEHLSNIAGFCDGHGKDVIKDIILMTFGTSMMEPMFLLQLNAFLPSIIGIQVDFTKKPPFKLVGFDIKALGTQIKGLAQR
jgi:hypothetical protein